MALTYTDVPGIAAAAFAGPAPPGLVHGAADDNAANLARFAWTLTLAPDTLISVADVSSTTFELRLGHAGGLDANDGTAVSVLPCIVTNVLEVSGSGGAATASFDVAVDTTGSPTLPSTSIQAWRGGPGDNYDYADRGTRLPVSRHGAVAEYDVVMTTTPPGSPWAGALGGGNTVRLPPGALARRDEDGTFLSNSMLIFSDIDDRPTVPLQTTFAVSNMAYAPSTASPETTGTFTGRITLHMPPAIGVALPTPTNIAVNTRFGRVRVYLTLGGHPDDDPLIRSASTTGTLAGVATSTFAAARAVSPSVNNVLPTAYTSGGQDFLRYTMQVTRYTEISAAGDLTFDFECDVSRTLIQSPQAHLTNVMVTLGNPDAFLPGDVVHMISAAPDGGVAQPSAPPLGPLGGEAGTTVGVLAERVRPDVPMVLLGGTLQRDWVNGSPAGIRLQAIVGGAGIANDISTAIDTGVGVTFECVVTTGDVSFSGSRPSEVETFDTAETPLLLTPVSFMGAALPQQAPGVGVSNVFLLDLETGNVPAMTDPAVMRQAFADIPAMTDKDDASIAALLVRSTTVGGPLFRFLSSDEVQLPLAIPLQSASQTFDPATGTVRMSGVVQWTDATVPPLYRQLNPIDTPPDDVLVHSFATSLPPPVFPTFFTYRVDRRHPTTAVGAAGALTTPDIAPADGSASVLTAPGESGPVTSDVTDGRGGAHIINIVASHTATPLTDQRYYFEASFPVTSVTAPGGGAPVAPFPFVFGLIEFRFGIMITGRIRTVRTFMFVDAPSVAETPLLLIPPATPLPLPTALADVFPVQEADTAPAVSVPARTDGVPERGAVVHMTPYAPGAGPAGFPPTLDAAAVSTLQFVLRVIAFTSPDGGSTLEPRTLTEAPATAAVEPDGRVAVQSLPLRAGDVDALGIYAAFPRQVRGGVRVVVDVRVDGVRLAAPVAAPGDALPVNAATVTHVTTAPALTETGSASATLTVGVSYTLLEHGVRLGPASDPSDVGALAAAGTGFVGAPSVQVTATSSSDETQSMLDTAPRPLALPAGLTLVPDTLTIGGAPGVAQADGGVLWSGIALDPSSVIAANSVDAGVAVAANLSVLIVSDGGAVAFLLGGITHALPGALGDAQVIFPTAVRGVPLVAFVPAAPVLSPNPVVVVLPPVSTPQQRQIAAAITAPTILVPASVTGALQSIASSVSADAASAAAEDIRRIVESSPGEAQDAVLRLTNTQTAAQTTEPLTRSRAGGIVRLLEVQGLQFTAANYIRRPLDINFDIQSVQDFNRFMSIHELFPNG